MADNFEVHEGLVHALERMINIRTVSDNWHKSCNITVVKKGFDIRRKKLQQPRFSYTIDVEFPTSLQTFCNDRLSVVPGRIETIQHQYVEGTNNVNNSICPTVSSKTPSVVVVGCGPAGELIFPFPCLLSDHFF